MLEVTDPRQNRFLPPGTRVRLDAYVNDDDQTTSKYGVVVHCWLDDKLGMFDCYVAFFGDAFPTEAPIETPYILRYGAISLNVLKE